MEGLKFKIVECKLFMTDRLWDKVVVISRILKW